jgi:hypothetical protein
VKNLLAALIIPALLAVGGLYQVAQHPATALAVCGALAGSLIAYFAFTHDKRRTGCRYLILGALSLLILVTISVVLPAFLAEAIAPAGLLFMVVYGVLLRQERAEFDERDEINRMRELTAHIKMADIRTRLVALLQTLQPGKTKTLVVPSTDAVHSVGLWLSLSPQWRDLIRSKPNGSLDITAPATKEELESLLKELGSTADFDDQGQPE